MTRRPKPRLAPLPVAEILEASAAGASDAELAARYGRDRTTISRLVRGETHARADGPRRVTGRPVRGEVATVSVELPVELRDRIDAARGEESRSAWMRRAAEERIARGQSASEYTEREMRLIRERDAALDRAENSEGATP